VGATGPFQVCDRTFRFGPFHLSERDGELCKNGIRIKLQEQPFQVLLVLVSNAGKVVSREELHQKLWPADTFVDFDTGLNTAVRKLRQALQDDAEKPRFVETLARRGYRFIAPVEAGSDEQTAPPAPIPAVEFGAATLPETQLAKPNPGRRDATPNTKTNVQWLRVLTLVAFAILGLSGPVIWKTTRTAGLLVNERRITANTPEAPITGAVISPDGKLVVYSDPTGVYLRPIDSGEARRLQLPEGFDAFPTSWFPDSTYFLLCVLERGQEYPGVWKMSALGGSPEKLIDRAVAGMVSNDGSRIAFVRSSQETLSIWLAGPDGEYPREIVNEIGVGTIARNTGFSGSAVYFGSTAPRLAWSPDNQRIAYVGNFWGEYGEPRWGVRFTLQTVPVDGGNPSLVLESNQLRPALAWAPDGRMFFAESGGENIPLGEASIWSVPVDAKTGKPQGKPTQVSSGAGRIGGLSLSKNGSRLLLWRANTQPGVFITDRAGVGGRFSSPRRLTLDENTNVASGWTPDGQEVLLLSARSGKKKLYRQRIDRPAPELILDEEAVLPRMGDDRHVFYISRDKTKIEPNVKLMSVPLSGGAPEVLLEMRDLYVYECSSGSAPVCLISTENVDRSGRIDQFDLTKRTTKEIFRYPAVKEAVNWTLSPDGTTLAMVRTGEDAKVTFMDIRDRTTREVLLPGWASLNNIDWAAGGRSVLAIAQTAAGNSVVLEIEPSGKSEVRLEGDKSAHYLWAIESPDGKHVLLEQVTGENNVWLIENF